MLGITGAQTRRQTLAGQQQMQGRHQQRQATEPEAALLCAKGRGRRQHQAPAAPTKQHSAATVLSLKRKTSQGAAPCAGYKRRSAK
jgi:hypothetical protein